MRASRSSIPARSGASPGAASDAARLLPPLYDELCRLAAHYLRFERARDALRPADLVHEAYLRLADHSRARPRNRIHFVALAAIAMRRVLVDQARSRGMAKRGGGVEPIRLDELPDPAGAHDECLVELHDALFGLAERAPELLQIVELRFFEGRTVEEAARALGVSPKTIGRRWALARSWLQREITRN